ncbi:Pentatricopeptide repeat-containing protein [Drosera capensis]
MLHRHLRQSTTFIRRFSSTAISTENPKPTPPTSAAAADAAKSGSKGGDTLGRRLFSLTYSKRSAAVTLRKWKEEGRTIRKFELGRIVRELRKLKRYKHALEICEWMRIQDDIKLVPGDYAIHLDLIAKLRGSNSAEKFFTDLPEEMKAQSTCTALLHAYVQGNEYVKAEALMDELSERGFLNSPLPYNHMLSMYISLGQLEKVPELIRRLKKSTSPDLVTYNMLLSIYASMNNVEAAEKIFEEVKKAKIEPDWLTYSTLTSLYIKEGLNEKAASSLMEIEKKASRKTRAAHSSLLSLFTNAGDKDGVNRTWKKMKSVYQKLNDAEYMCMISSLIKLGVLEEAENLHAEWESISPTGDTRVPNLLLAGYINKDMFSEAEAFYKRIVQKGIKPSYTTLELLTWGYLKQRQMAKFLDCFEKAVGSVKKWVPDEKLIREMYKNLEETGNVEGAEKLLAILRKAGYVTTKIYNMLLRTYAKAGTMPLVVAERMREDEVELDEETGELLRLSSKMRISVVSSCLT